MNSFLSTVEKLPTGHPVKVYCDATTTSSARKIIEAQFDVKSWFKMMSTVYK